MNPKNLMEAIIVLRPYIGIRDQCAVKSLTFILPTSKIPKEDQALLFRLGAKVRADRVIL